ncbi:hypothetical protein CSUI_010595 [Cystoisospora suis]|uniref:Transmembrane protein n=1 Tax=Cystoisospora suis TaxID=483139 RepID=A0A2C6KFY2_9APIC|nr:hypothetical protein CSUI_010595 [Cystoisospora suis]
MDGLCISFLTRRDSSKKPSQHIPHVSSDTPSFILSRFSSLVLSSSSHSFRSSSSIFSPLLSPFFLSPSSSATLFSCLSSFRSSSSSPSPLLYSLIEIFLSAFPSIQSRVSQLVLFSPPGFFLLSPFVSFFSSSSSSSPPSFMGFFFSLLTSLPFKMPDNPTKSFSPFLSPSRLSKSLHTSTKLSSSFSSPPSAFPFLDRFSEMPGETYKELLRPQREHVLVFFFFSSLSPVFSLVLASPTIFLLIFCHYVIHSSLHFFLLLLATLSQFKLSFFSS